MATVTVLHNLSLDASFGLNATFSAEGKAHAPRSHELVRVFTFDTAELVSPGEFDTLPHNGEAMADAIFRAFNVGDDPLMTSTVSREYTLACKYRARQLRSLSVGDVLVFDDEVFLACEMAGWKRVGKGELRVLDAQAAERVIRKRYDFRANETLTVTVPLEG